jgi:hypothetical protein
MMRDLLIAVEIATTMRVFPIILQTLKSAFRHAFPFMIALPMHLTMVQFVPVLSLCDCVLTHGAETLETCIDTSQICNMPYELLSLDTFKKNLDIVHFSLGLFENGTAHVIRNAFTAIAAKSA